MRIIGIFWALLALLMACEGDKGSSPKPPEDLQFGGDSAIPEQPVEDELPDIPLDDADEGDGLTDDDEDEEQVEGTRLEVVSVDMLPLRIAECVNQGVAGEVVNGVFTCNNQALISCNGLPEAQKFVAKAYADEQLPGYSLYGCSLSAEENPHLHYFMLDGAALRVFNLEIQRSGSN